MWCVVSICPPACSPSQPSIFPCNRWFVRQHARLPCPLAVRPPVLQVARVRVPARARARAHARARALVSCASRAPRAPRAARTCVPVCVCVCVCACAPARARVRARMLVCVCARACSSACARACACSALVHVRVRVRSRAREFLLAPATTAMDRPHHNSCPRVFPDACFSCKEITRQWITTTTVQWSS